MLAQALFTTNEQGVFKLIYKGAAKELHGALGLKTSQEKQNSFAVLNRIYDIVKKNSIDFQTVLEINARQSVNAIPSIKLKDKEIKADRNCNPHSNSELRKAIFEIFTELSKILGLDLHSQVSVNSHVEGIPQNVSNGYIKVIENRNLIKWIRSTINEAFNGNSDTVTLGFSSRHKCTMNTARFSEKLHSLVFNSSLNGLPGHAQDLRNQNALHALNDLSDIIEYENSLINPYCSNDDDFRFPYTKIEQILAEFGISENQANKESIIGDNGLLNKYGKYLSEREIIWVMMRFQGYYEKSDSIVWERQCRNLYKAKKQKHTLNIPDGVFDKMVTSNTERNTTTIHDTLENVDYQSQLTSTNNRSDQTTERSIILSLNSICDQQKRDIEIKKRNYGHYLKPIHRFVKVFIIPQYGQQQYGSDQQLVQTINTNEVGTEIIQEIDQYMIEINNTDSNLLQEHFIPNKSSDLISMIYKNYSTGDSLKKLDEAGRLLKEIKEISKEKQAGEYSTFIYDSLKSLSILIHNKEDLIVGYEVIHAHNKIKKSLKSIEKSYPQFFEEYGISSDLEDYKTSLKKYGLDYGKMIITIQDLFASLSGSLLMSNSLKAREGLDEYTISDIELDMVPIREILGISKTLKAPKTQKANQDSGIVSFVKDIFS